jgi:molybdopterin converting factor small subunit
LVKDIHSMEVQVKLYSEMRQYAPGKETDFELALVPGATVGHVFARLKIPSTIQRVVLLNGKRANESTILEERSTLVLFSPISGG